MIESEVLHFSEYISSIFIKETLLYLNTDIQKISSTNSFTYL